MLQAGALGVEETHDPVSQIIAAAASMMSLGTYATLWRVDIGHEFDSPRQPNASYETLNNK